MSNQDPLPVDEWVKATASGQGAECVELRHRAGAVEVRDSKDPHGPVLRFSTAQFAGWLRGAGNGEYSRLTD
jgi:hypothetical protein